MRPDERDVQARRLVEELRLMASWSAIAVARWRVYLSCREALSWRAAIRAQNASMLARNHRIRAQVIARALSNRKAA